MESFQRVQSMIQEARQWLDKAEKSYKNSNPIRGELDLHLAQAEIQRACETSRILHFSTPYNEPAEVREQTSSRMRYYLTGAAAVIIGFVFITSLALFNYDGSVRMRNRSLMGASFHVEPIYIYLSDDPSASHTSTAVTVKNSAKSPSRTPTAAVKHGINPNSATAMKRNGNRTFSNYEDTEIQADTDTPDFSRFYEVPGTRGNQWHTASTHWGEDRIIRNSVPSFSRDISNEGGR